MTPICCRARQLCSMLERTTSCTGAESEDLTLPSPPPIMDSMSISMSPMSSILPAPTTSWQLQLGLLC